MSKRRLCLALLAAAALGGCGDADNEEFVITPPTETTAITRSLTGIVRDPNGAPVAGALVALEERSTQFDVETTTDQNGAYDVELPEGVYDLRVDGPADLNSAFEGPLELDSNLSQDFALELADPRPGLIRGQLLLRPGQPAANRRLRFVPVSTSSTDPNVVAEVPEPVETTTDDRGNFEVDLGWGQEVNLDVEVFSESGDLDEFVNLPKPSGSLNVELRVETPAEENTVRAGAGAENAGRVVSGPSPARFAVRVDSGPFFDAFFLEGGLIPLDNRDRPWSAYLSRPTDVATSRLAALLFDPGASGGTPSVKGVPDGGFGQSRQLVVTTGAFTAPQVEYIFYDRAGGTHALRVSRGGAAASNVLDFNSAQPEIVEVQIRL